MADIIVKDRDGNDVTHVGAAGIRVRTTDAEKVFIDGDTVPNPVETTVELDFSAGDMNVIPEDGSVFEKVTIPKPSALIPENIAEGMDVAGIVGTLVAGGGANAKVKFAQYSTSSADKPTGTRIPVDFGFVPDFILMYTIYTGAVSNLNSNYGRVFMGFSTDGNVATGAYPITTVFYQSSSTVGYKEGFKGIEVAGTASTDPIYGADETGFNIGAKGLKSYNTYYIFAIKFT